MSAVSNVDVRDDGGKYYSGENNEYWSREATNKGLELVELNKKLKELEVDFKKITDCELVLSTYAGYCKDIMVLVGNNIEPKLKEIGDICKPYKIPGYYKILDFSEIIGKSSILDQTYNSCESYREKIVSTCKHIDVLKETISNHIYHLIEQISEVKLAQRCALGMAKMYRDEDNKVK